MTNNEIEPSKTYMRIEMKKVQFLKKTVSSCQKQSAKPPGSNSSHRLRFVLELRNYYLFANAMSLKRMATLNQINDKVHVCSH